MVGPASPARTVGISTPAACVTCFIETESPVDDRPDGLVRVLGVQFGD